jgi:hypothetical protein
MELPFDFVNWQNVAHILHDIHDIHDINPIFCLVGAEGVPTVGAAGA